MTISFRLFPTRLGHMAIAATPRGLRHVFLPEGSQTAQRRKVRATLPEAIENDRLLPDAVTALQRYCDGAPVTFHIPLDLALLPPFTTNVLRACARIPYGQTVSYQRLAELTGRPKAARAVGTVMSRNPLPIVIPCHRVLKTDGSLGGYSGALGVNFKSRLLRMEANTSAAPGLFQQADAAVS